MGDAVGNVQAALALLSHVDPRRAARLQSAATAVYVVDLTTAVSTDGRVIRISNAFALEYPSEAIAIGLIVGLTSIRFGRLRHARSLDSMAQIRRRQRLEAFDFARGLEDPVTWQKWITDWLIVAAESDEEREARVVGDLRRNNVPEWFIRTAVVLSRAWKQLRARSWRGRSSSRPAT